MKCPPCTNNCHQGTDCPARRPMPTPESASSWAVFAECAFLALAVALLALAVIQFINR